MRHVGDVALLDDDVRLCHALVGIALEDGRARAVVALADDILGGSVRRPVLVQQRCSGLEGGLDVADDLERLVVDLDQLDGPLGDLVGECRHRRDQLALVAHLVLGEQPPVLDERPVADVGHVIVRDHGEHPRQLPCLGGVDARDAGVGVVGVAELGLEHAGHVQVGGVAPKTGHLVLAVLPDERLLCCGQRELLQSRRGLILP